MCFHSQSVYASRDSSCRHERSPSSWAASCAVFPGCGGQIISISSHILRVQPVVLRNWVSVVRFDFGLANSGVLQPRAASQLLSQPCAHSAAVAVPDSHGGDSVDLQRCHTSGNVLHDQTGGVISEPEPEQPVPDTPAAACQQQAPPFVCSIIRGEVCKGLNRRIVPVDKLSSLRQ